MSSTLIILLSLFGGILPAFLWLWFWLREDKHPEPGRFIALAFVTGMASVALAIPLQEIVSQKILGGIQIRDAFSLFPLSSFITIILWALVEESLKLGSAYIAVLRKRVNDEPIDAVIYIITASLGFAAAENALFLSDPLAQGSALAGFITGNMRFVGATLLHVVAGSASGVALSLAFYKTRPQKAFYLFIGLILAIALHTLFNLLIMIGIGFGALLAFILVWIAVIFLLMIFERIKRVHPIS